MTPCAYIVFRCFKQLLEDAKDSVEKTAKCFVDQVTRYTVIST